MTIRRLLVCICVLCFALMASIVLAGNAEAEGKYKEAVALYDQRADLAKVGAAVQLLDAAAKEATDEALKYRILVLHSQCIYWQGTHTKDETQKVAVFDAGRAKADEARKVNGDWAEAYYQYAINLGRWAEANGVMQSLFKKKELIDTLAAIFERDTSDGQPGDTYCEYGADRVLGRLYFKLPPFAGGSLEKAMKHLSRAYLKGKNNGTNIIYYAEALFASGEKDKARQALDEFIAAATQDPKAFNPTRVPETVEELDDAKRLRKEMGN